jgi:hypothetical protein
MVSQRERHLFLGLGLTVALVLAVGLLPAIASAASTLTGENLSGSSASGNTPFCPAATWSVSGTATGPYPGTFSESGTSAPGGGGTNATFTINSGTTTITGSKSTTDSACLISGSNFSMTLSGVPYTATIHTPSGNFHDEGTSAVNVAITPSGAATLTESFTSSLAQPVLIAPTSKDQCKNNGWKNFPQFKNQGQCVSSVQSQSQT